MWKGLGLRLRTGGRGERSLRFGRGGSMGEEIDFVGDSATKVVEGFANIRRVIVGFVGVLGAGPGLVENFSHKQVSETTHVTWRSFW